MPPERDAWLELSPSQLYGRTKAGPFITSVKVPAWLLTWLPFTYCSKVAVEEAEPPPRRTWVTRVHVLVPRFRGAGAVVPAHVPEMRVLLLKKLVTHVPPPPYLYRDTSSVPVVDEAVPTAPEKLYSRCHALAMDSGLYMKDTVRPAEPSVVSWKVSNVVGQLR